MTNHAHPADTTDFREQKIEWKKLKLSERNGVYVILGAVMLLALLQIGASRFGQGENAIGYETDIFIEVLSVAFTILVLDRLAEMREERRLKDRLVHEAGSRSNERAKAAIDDLRHYGWLTGEDGLLKDANLRGANLEGADLREVNLQGVKLKYAKLERADLREANLEGANLREANLEEADLKYAKLERADLREANLQRANLLGANLQGANLRYAKLEELNLTGANLQGANLSRANLQRANLRYANLLGAILMGANLADVIFYDEEYEDVAIMPNGERWHEGMDLEMFTNPNHPEFYDPHKQDAGE